MSVARHHTANLLGALALVVADQMDDAMMAVAGQSTSAATALSALHHFLDGPSIDLLRQVLGLTSSGTVRLIDKLEEAGYVTRGSGSDARTTAVALTDAGRRVAEQVSAARADVLSGALAALSSDQEEQLAMLLAALLPNLIRGPGATRWMCRMCDTSACGRERGECPVANEAMRRYPS